MNATEQFWKDFVAAGLWRELPGRQCTRCRQDNTHARDVYFPLSDEYIYLCTDCEPEDTAVSSFELWHANQRISTTEDPR